VEAHAALHARANIWAGLTRAVHFALHRPDRMN